MYGWLWARMADAAGEDGFGVAKRQLADFYMARLMPMTAMLAQTALADSRMTMASDAI